jgi:hypothetical protein
VLRPRGTDWGERVSSYLVESILEEVHDIRPSLSSTDLKGVLAELMAIEFKRQRVIPTMTQRRNRRSGVEAWDKVGQSSFRCQRYGFALAGKVCRR